jgi:transposase
MRRVDEHKGDWKAWRCLRAWEWAQQGWSQKQSAEALGVTEGAVSQWMKSGREQGVEGLRGKIAEGPPSRLTEKQLEHLPALLDQGAEVHGFRGAVWTRQRVAMLLKKQGKVSSHPAHRSRVLKSLNYSVQQPEEKATQRDETAISMWKEEYWPALIKSSRGRQNDRFRRRGGVLSTTDAGLHLCTSGADAHGARAADARSSVGYRWDHCGWPTVHADARARLSGRTRGRIFAPASAQDPRQAAGDLGWLSSSPGKGRPSVARSRSSQAAPPGTSAWLCSRTEPKGACKEKPSHGSTNHFMASLHLGNPGVLLIAADVGQVAREQAGDQT